MSMLLYIIFQEGLYCAIKSNRNIRSIELPNEISVKLLGYADDTNVFPRDDSSIVEIDLLIRRFEKATGTLLNCERKSKIYGIGCWKDRESWPLSWLTTQKDYFPSLGILYCNDFDRAVFLAWEKVVVNIQIRIGMLSSRKLTIFQKAVIVNTLVLSKLWYTAHVYPLPVSYVKPINRLVFGYVWSKGYDPIKRETLMLPKTEGGISLIDIRYKSQSILTKSFLKGFCNENINFMLIYYTGIRLQQILDVNRLPNNVSFTGTSYFDEVIKVLRLCLKIPNFPHVKTNTIYEEIKPKCRPAVEENYPLFKWKEVWRNIGFHHITPTERDTLYRHLHEILPNNKRLFQMKKSMSPMCQ